MPGNEGEPARTPAGKRLSPWLEAYCGYENSPRHVRWFWNTVGAILAIAAIPAGIWVVCMAFIGVVEALEASWRVSPWGTLAAIGVLVLSRALRERLPPFWRE